MQGLDRYIRFSEIMTVVLDIVISQGIFIKINGEILRNGLSLTAYKRRLLLNYFQMITGTIYKIKISTCILN